MTTEQTTRVVPAGWYQDPADDAKVRWWNGLTWTEHVETKPAGAAAGVAGARALESGTAASGASDSSTEQRAAEARELERQYGISTGESAIITRRASMTLDARGPSTGTIPIQGMSAPRRPARTGTTSAWLLAATPLITSVLALVAAYVYFYVSPTPLVAAAGVVLFLLGFLWAVGDARALQARGITPASPMWALALPLVGPLLYLVNRRRAVSGSGPLLMFVALFVIAIAGPVALWAVGGAQTVTKALEVQLAVSSDLISTGSALSVSCPPIVETTAAGSIFTCDAVTPAGDTVKVWVSFDDEQGQFSWAMSNR